MGVDFDVRLATAGDATTVIARGDLDMAAAAEFATACDEALDHNPRRLLLDLRDVPFIDSVGLNVMVRVSRRATAGFTDLRIANPSEAVLRMLRLTGLDRLLHLEDPDHT